MSSVFMFRFFFPTDVLSPVQNPIQETTLHLKPFYLMTQDDAPTQFLTVWALEMEKMILKPVRRWGSAFSSLVHCPLVKSLL